jgi:hypothetical protein
MEAFAQKPRKRSAGRSGKPTKRPICSKRAKDPVNDAPTSSNTESSKTGDSKAAAVPQPNARKRLPDKSKAKVTKRTSKTKTKVCKVKISKASVPTYDMVEAYEEEFLGLAIASISEFELFSIEEVEKEILGKEAPQSSPNDDALSALATVASFLSNAPTTFDSPGDKGFTLHNTSTIHFSPILAGSVEGVDTGIPAETDDTAKAISDESEPLTKALLMAIYAEKEHLLVPTPIKLTSNSHVDFSHEFDLGIDDVVGMEEDQMSYSFGSLSSPYKPLLPHSDRSAFTPIISQTDHMITELYESMVANMD